MYSPTAWRSPLLAWTTAPATVAQDSSKALAAAEQPSAEPPAPALHSAKFVACELHSSSTLANALATTSGRMSALSDWNTPALLLCIQRPRAPAAGLAALARRTATSMLAADGIVELHWWDAGDGERGCRAAEMPR